MTPEIRALYNEQKPLPLGTKILTSTGYEILSEVARNSANRIPNHLSIDRPFWLFGWLDLHDKLLGPNESIHQYISCDKCMGPVRNDQIFVDTPENTLCKTCFNEGIPE